MPGSEQSIAAATPSWNEADSFRETTLQLIEDPADREAMRHAGRVLYDLATEGGHRISTESSPTRANLGAIAADLRYTGGYCAMVHRSAAESSLNASDSALARFAGHLATRVAALVKAIEARLS
jgi:hypothetical protein